MGDVDPCPRGVAGVGVRLTVAATGALGREEVWIEAAVAVAAARRTTAVGTSVAIGVDGHRPRCAEDLWATAGTVVGALRARPDTRAIVRVGDAITAAHRSEDLGTRVGYVHTPSLPIRRTIVGDVTRHCQ